MRAVRGSPRRRPTVRLAALTTLFAAVLVAGGTTSAIATNRESSMDEPRGLFPDQITAGPDGNVWFTEFFGDTIGRITPSGVIGEFPTSLGHPPGSPGEPVYVWDISSGPDGALWFVGDAPVVGRMTTTGVVTRFPIRPDQATQLLSITAGPDGNLWFTSNSPGIRRITPTGALTVFPFASARSPWQIIAGPDGNVWFTEINDGRLGRITPQGAVTEFPTRPGAGPPAQTDRIAAGPDGNLWFTELWFSESAGEPEMVHSRIGRMTPDGLVTRFVPGAAEGAGINGITAGPDGNVWFTVSEPDRIGRITPTGLVTLFRRGITPGSGLREITAGADGNLWFTEAGGRRIGRITPTGVVTEFPPTPTIGAVRLRGTSAVIVHLRCPPAAPASCGGTVQLKRGRSRLGVRHYRLAPGQRAEVPVPLWAAGRRQLRSLGRLPVTVRVVWRPHTSMGTVERYAVLRLPRPPAVAG